MRISTEVQPLLQLVLQMNNVTPRVHLEVKTGSSYLSDFPSSLLIAAFMKTIKKQKKDYRLNLGLRFTLDYVSSKSKEQTRNLGEPIE